MRVAEPASARKHGPLGQGPDQTYGHKSDNANIEGKSNHDPNIGMEQLTCHHRNDRNRCECVRTSSQKKDDNLWKRRAKRKWLARAHNVPRNWLQWAISAPLLGRPVRKRETTSRAQLDRGSGSDGVADESFSKFPYRTRRPMCTGDDGLERLLDPTAILIGDRE